MRTSSLTATLGIAVLLSPLASLAPAHAAGEGVPVQVVAHTSLESDLSDFDSSLAGCETGTVVNGDDVHVSFAPWGGVFNGSKEFTCADGESGFTLRLKARFGADGSTGSWNVVEGWGAYDGLKGSGSLVGIPQTEVQIDDVFTGLFR